MSNRETIPERWRRHQVGLREALFVGTLALIVLTGAFRLRPWWLPIAGIPILIVGGIATMRWRRGNRARRLSASDWSLCVHCGHDLRGIGDHGVCPECGWAFELSQTRSAWRETLGMREPS